MKNTDKNTGLSAQRLTRCALLTAVALVIHIAEALLPPPAPIPGIRLGLANVITLFSLFWLGPADTALILFVRILLGSVFGGQMISFFFSLAGGLFCFGIELLLYRHVSDRQVWVCGAAGALFHNIGQVLAAVLVFGTASVLIWLPVLALSGMVTGLFTGLAAQFLLRHFRALQMP